MDQPTRPRAPLKGRGQDQEDLAAERAAQTSTSAARRPPSSTTCSSARCPSTPRSSAWSPSSPSTSRRTAARSTTSAGSTGTTFLEIAKGLPTDHSVRFVGIDSSREMLEVARRSSLAGQSFQHPFELRCEELERGSPNTHPAHDLQEVQSARVEADVADGQLRSGHRGRRNEERGGRHIAGHRACERIVLIHALQRDRRSLDGHGSARGRRAPARCGHASRPAR